MAETDDPIRQTPAQQREAIRRLAKTHPTFRVSYTTADLEKPLIELESANTREVERRGRRKLMLESLRKALQKHHDWHLQSGAVGLPDGNGGFIEIDNALEYSESILCSETIAALSSTSKKE